MKARNLSPFIYNSVNDSNVVYLSLSSVFVLAYRGSKIITLQAETIKLNEKIKLLKPNKIAEYFKKVK